MSRRATGGPDGWSSPRAIAGQNSAYRSPRHRPAADVRRQAITRARARAVDGPPNIEIERKGKQVIFNDVRDPRLITVRRGGTLGDDEHHLLAAWAADCAEHVLHYFETDVPGDDRPRRAIELARAWSRGQIPMMNARAAGGHAMAAARTLVGAPRDAAYAAGQAACVAHVAEHELGAAAYAIRAVRAAAREGDRDDAGGRECLWQRAQLPEPIRELVLDDERLRNERCWSVFDC